MQRIPYACYLAAAMVSLLPVRMAAAEETSSQPHSYCARLKYWFRGKVVKKADLRRYGLRLDHDWRDADRDKNLVVLIHGFNSKGELNGDVVEPLREAGFPCGMFDYANDDSLSKAAKLLSGELQYFASMYPSRGVSLVTHSMGGLVARECVENPQLYSRNVRQLIMIGTPNHGSLLAHFAFGGDCWEHGRFWNHEGGPWTRTKACVIDGLSEAVRELRPGSEFLAKLDSRKRDPNVQYTNILGTGARLRGWELTALGKTARWTTKPFACVAGRGENFEQMMDDLDEVRAGKGDGVVAVKRGRLEGVEDTHVFEFGHLRVTEEAEDGPVRKVHELIFRRLQEAPTGVPELNPIP